MCIRLAEREEKNTEAKSVFKKIIAKHPILMKDKNLHIQEAEQLPNSKNPKK